MVLGPDNLPPLSYAAVMKEMVSLPSGLQMELVSATASKKGAVKQSTRNDPQQEVSIVPVRWQMVGRGACPAITRPSILRLQSFVLT